MATQVSRSVLPAGVVALIALLAPATAAIAADEAPWTWAGLEILGNHTVPRAEIEKLIPIPMGGEWRQGDPPVWKESCAAVKERFDFAEVLCPDRPLLVFGGRKAYLVVDVVEKGRESRVNFRAAPTGSVPFANDEMVRLSQEVGAKTMAAAMAGHGYNETGTKGYLVYEDKSGTNEDMTPAVERLAQLVPQYRDNLFAVLRGEADKNARREAATLLNWAGDPDRTMREALTLLDDPEDGVRNNLSRYMIHFSGQVTSKRLRHRMIDTFVRELDTPSHGDRNKGLYNLLAIAQARPDDHAYILDRGGDALRYLGENSILFNVQGPARDLLELLAPSRVGCMPTSGSGFRQHRQTRSA